jgi:hypothetical protein
MVMSTELSLTFHEPNKVVRRALLDWRLILEGGLASVIVFVAA